MTDEIRELVKKYNENHDENESVKEENEKKRKSFVEDFPIDKINSLKIEDFVLGDIDEKSSSERGPKGRGTFIYRMEYEIRNQTDYEKANKIKAPTWLMGIKSSNGKKWGCYSIETESEFKNTIKLIEKVLDVHNINNYAELLNSKPFIDMIVCKLLATYYPDRFLPNGSDEYAKKFLEKVGVEYGKNEKVLELNDRIIKWKNSNEETKNWENLDITRFMYGSDYMNLKQKNEKKDKNKMKKDNKTSEKDQNKNSLDLKMNKNIILYGPPGTGKTYSTIAYALSICCGDKTYEDYLNDLISNRKEITEKYNALKQEGRISFVTFHQSYG